MVLVSVVPVLRIVVSLVVAFQVMMHMFFRVIVLVLLHL
jgi:hypothetical protein